LKINLSLLEFGVSGGLILLNNKDGFYNTKVDEYDPITVSIWRIGESETVIFAGRVVQLGWDADLNRGVRNLPIYVEDYGQEFHAPPDFLTKAYDAVSGKTIIEEALVLCSDVTMDSTDDGSDIASTHTEEFEDANPYDVITKICRKAKTGGGAVGFDAYIDKDKKLHIFYRGKYTSSINVAGRFINYLRTDDIHRVRSKFQVYGAAEKTYPALRDSWSESLTPTEGAWSCAGGAMSVSLDSSDKLYGSNSIKFTSTTDVTPDWDWFKFMLSPSSNYADAKKRHGLKAFDCWIKLDDKWSGVVGIALHQDGNINPSIKQLMSVEKEEWTPLSVSMGPDSEKWGSYFNGFQDPLQFQWDKVSGFYFMIYTSSGGTRNVRVDSPHFGKERFYGVQEDLVHPYGIRMAKPIIDDNLKSDAECLNFAAYKLNLVKTKLINLKRLTVEGDYFIPGYKQNIVTDDFSISNLRLLEIAHELKKTKWECGLTMGE